MSKIINYKSDFKLVECFRDSSLLKVPFKFTYYTKSIKYSYTVSYNGTDYINCNPTLDNRLMVIFDNHDLKVGQLKVKREFFLNDKDFQDGIHYLISEECLDIFLDKNVISECDEVTSKVQTYYHVLDIKTSPDLYYTNGTIGISDSFKNSKQDTILDLDTIRSNANKGATALQKVPSEYITESELNSKGYLTTHQDISHLANKSDIPTKVSQFINDSGYVTDDELSTAIADGSITTEKIAPKSVTAEQLSFATVEPIEVGTAGDSSLAILTKSGTEKTLLVPSALSLLMDENGDVVTFKTINGQPILGSGNIDIESGSGGPTEILNGSVTMKKLGADVIEEINNKQPRLASGVNISPINGHSLLSGENIQINGLDSSFIKTIGDRIFRFNGFMEADYIYESVENVSENDIYFQQSTNKFFAAKPTKDIVGDIFYYITGSSHTSYGIVTDYIASYDTYPMAYSDSYGFVRCDGRNIYINTTIPEEYQYKASRAYRLVGNTYRYFIWNSNGQLTEAFNIFRYSYKFKIGDNITDIDYLYDASFRNIFIDASKKSYEWKDGKLVNADVVVRKSELPTKVSQLTNDSGYSTKDEVAIAIANAITNTLNTEV